jgi:nucleoid-associated protein YgaU
LIGKAEPQLAQRNAEIRIYRFPRRQLYIEVNAMPSADIYEASAIGWGYGTRGDAGDATWIGLADHDAGFSLGGIVRGISHAVGDVTKLGANVVKGGVGWIREHDPVGHSVLQIARGERIDRALMQGVHLAQDTLKDVAPYVQTALAVIPGIGQGVSAALGASIALASGAPITEVLLAAAVATVPGGPIAQRAMQAGIAAVKAISEGKKLGDAALSMVRSQIPGGQAAKAAFDAGLALAQGKRIQEAAARALGTIGQGKLPGGAFGNAVLGAAQDVLRGQRIDRAVVSQGMRAVQSQAMHLAPSLDKLMPRGVSRLANQLDARRALGITQGLLGVPRITSDIGRTIGSISHGVVDSRIANVANALLGNPALRSLPIGELSRRLGMDETIIKRGMASLLQATKSVGSLHPPLVLPRLARAHDLEQLLHSGSSLDKALAQYASHVAPAVFSSSPVLAHAVRWRAMSRPLLEHIVRAVPAARALPPHHLRALTLQQAVTDAKGIDSTGTRYVVEAGDNPSKIALKVVHNGNRWQELVAANPQKPRAANGNFKTLLPGEILTLPASWGGGGGASPAPSTTVTPAVFIPTSGGGGGGTYAVLAGDNPSKIAQKIVHDGRRWPELVAANPQKPRAANGNFKTLLPGEILTLPASWGGNGGGATPVIFTPGATTLPTTVIKPGYDPHVQQAQVMLGFWASVNDASNPTRFGTDVRRDADGMFGPRTRGAMAQFQKYANATMGASLRTDGAIDDPSYQKLVEWNAQELAKRAGMPLPGGSIPLPGGGSIPLPGGGGGLPGLPSTGDQPPLGTPVSDGGPTGSGQMGGGGNVGVQPPGGGGGAGIALALAAVGLLVMSDSK